MAYLPDRAGAAIVAGLEDMVAVEKLPGHKIEMGFWYSRQHDTKECSLCLAGSSMKQKYGADDYIDDNNNLCPNMLNIPRQEKEKLVFIKDNLLRDGRPRPSFKRPACRELHEG